MGRAYADETESTPIFWSGNWVTINFYRSAAGFGRNGVTYTYRTWNLHTGQEVDIWRWLGGKSGEEGKSQLPVRLKHALFKGVKLADGCSDGYREEGYYRLQLKPDGIDLFEEEYGDGCGERFFIKYKKLAKFLTPEGKAALKDELK